MTRKTNPELDEQSEEVLDLDEADTDSDSDQPSRKPSRSGSGTTKRAAAKKTARGRATKSSGSKSASSGSKSAFVSGGKRPAAKGGKSGRRPVTPVKVSAQRPWGTIAMFTVVGLLFVAIVGYTGYVAWYSAKSPAERADMISGVKDYSSKTKAWTQPQHKAGKLKFHTSPPVAGTHNPIWQNCMGDVYDAPIANEHAVHSLEHGAIWITYQPGLAKDQVAALAKRVKGKEYMLMSPYKGLDTPISVQAWGFQLKLDDANDGRIDDFIKALRNQGPEKGATCSQGITVTGTKPHDVQPQQPTQPGG